VPLLGCNGQETDLLAVFEAPTGLRFALHVEVKNPGDSFSKTDQAPAYPVRAKCWSTEGKTPKRVRSRDPSRNRTALTQTTVPVVGDWEVAGR
jgi:hypothetical protein